MLQSRAAHLSASAREGGTRFRPASVERELSRVFRPELLNRIDRIVVFRPFEREQMRTLLERELDASSSTGAAFANGRGRSNGTRLPSSSSSRRGSASSSGARPLKRAVERYLLAPLAAAIVSRSFPEGDQFLFISARDDRIDVTFVDPDADDAEPSEPPPSLDLRLEQLVLSPGAARARAIFSSERPNGCAGSWTGAVGAAARSATWRR